MPLNFIYYFIVIFYIAYFWTPFKTGSMFNIIYKCTKLIKYKTNRSKSIEKVSNSMPQNVMYFYFSFLFHIAYFWTGFTSVFISMTISYPDLRYLVAAGWHCTDLG